MTVFKQIFCKVPQDELLEIRDRLFKLSKVVKANKIKRANNSQIDVSKVLRIMLEYYIKEKKIRVYILNELFEEKLQLVFIFILIIFR